MAKEHLNDDRPFALSTSGWRIAAVVGILVALALALVETLQRDGKALLVAIGLICFVIASSPLLVKPRFYIFEPIVLVAGTVFVGATLGSLFIALAGPYNYKLEFLTDGMSALQIASKALWVPLALAFLSGGYIVAQNKRFAIEKLRIFSSPSWSNKRLLYLSSTLAVISAVGILELFRETGVDLGDYKRLAIKRAVETDGGSYASLGYLRWVVDLSKVALLLIVSERLRSSKLYAKRPPLEKAFFAAIIVSLVFLSVVWPIVSSSRTGILETAFSVLVLLTYLGFRGKESAQRRRFFVYGLIAFIFALSVMAVMGLWRQSAQGPGVRDADLGDVLVNNTIASGNFFPLDRTALIIERMDGRDDWMFGESFANIVFAPIPRSFWPGKPEMSLGLYVKDELYGRPTYKSGYPPGLLGEAFINFWYFGLLVVPFIAGAALRVIFNSFNVLMERRNKAAVIVYSVLLWPLGFQLLALDFTLTLINIGMAVIPLFLILGVISKRQRYPTCGMRRVDAY